MKINIKFSHIELQAFSDLIQSSMQCRSDADTIVKCLCSILVTLYTRLHNRTWLITNDKPVSVNLTITEAYAIKVLIPRLKINNTESLAISVRAKVLMTIDPKLK